jgi:hypothetical protein
MRPFVGLGPQSMIGREPHNISSCEQDSWLQPKEKCLQSQRNERVGDILRREPTLLFRRPLAIFSPQFFVHTDYPEENP